MLNKLNTKISIITFNFCDYDLIHNHILNDNYNYLYISDNKKQSLGWNNIIFDNFIEDNWKKTIYIRYHPFEFTDSDIVVIFDGSMEIQNGLYLIIDKFIKENYDICFSLSHQSHLNNRINNWYNTNRITKEEKQILEEYLIENKAKNYFGCVSAAFRIYKKSNELIKYLNKCYEMINNKKIRLDEIVSSVELFKYDKLFNKLILTPDIFNGSVFKYYKHGTNNQIFLPELYGKTYFNNKKCIPYHIESSYHRKYEYKSEAMCLTKYLDSESLKEWIEYHLNIGFEHIHIFDNESTYNCKEICEEYGDKVSYDYIEGYARHYKIYDDYVNSERCKSEWIIPIDDDEYFELNKNICTNINSCIDWYKNKFPYDEMFAIRWKHLFPKVFHSEPTGNILEYCTEEDSKIAELFQPMGDRGVKTIVHRFGNIHYEEAEENPTGGHVPKHSSSSGAKLYDGHTITSCSCNLIPKTLDEPARLIHCRYKGYTWYKNKYMNKNSKNYCYGNCSSKPYIKNYKFNCILETLQ